MNATRTRATAAQRIAGGLLRKKRRNHRNRACVENGFIVVWLCSSFVGRRRGHMDFQLCHQKEVENTETLVIQLNHNRSSRWGMRKEVPAADQNCCITQCR